MLSEILPPLLSSHHEFLLDNLRGRRPFGHKDKLEVSDNLVDNFVIFDKGDHFHLSVALRARLLPEIQTKMRIVLKNTVFLEKGRDKKFLTIVSLLVLNMSDIKSILDRMKRNPNNVRFRELCKICEYYFGLPRIKKGNHRVYKMPWPGDPRVNIQNHKGMAKIYQVKQVIKALEKLESENDSEE